MSDNDAKKNAKKTATAKGKSASKPFNAKGKSATASKGAHKGKPFAAGKEAREGSRTGGKGKASSYGKGADNKAGKGSASKGGFDKKASFKGKDDKKRTFAGDAGKNSAKKYDKKTGAKSDAKRSGSVDKKRSEFSGKNDSFDKKKRTGESFEAKRSQGGKTSAKGSAGKQGQAKGKPKQNPRRDKKAFDRQKVETLMSAESRPYAGQLDPRKGERSNIAPGRKTRELRDAAKDAQLEAAEEERREREKLDDDTLTPAQKFYKNEASPARLAALDVTRAVRRRKAYAHDLIEARIDTSDMSAADRAFATLLVLGVVSTSGTLDDIINRGMRKPTDAFDDVRDALRISTYEMYFLGKTPHAAIDQGVELVRAVSPSAAGLGNAILHRVLELRESFPFGDPNHDIEALARAYAFPSWLARKLVEDLGAKEASAHMHASNEPAPLFIAVNALKATDDEVIAVFAKAGATLRPAVAQGIAPAGCYHVSDPRAIADKRVAKLFDEGKILVADASAQAVAAAIFDGFAPESILEVGAGRGTKTVLLQSNAQRLLGHQVQLTSLDMHEFKVKLLSDRAAQYGVQLQEAVVGNGCRLDQAVGQKKYQTVFIDAPCSGLGTLRRHPEIRWRISSKHIAELADTGLSMLRSAAQQVEEGGQLVYATCTVTYDENYGVVKRFLEETPEGKAFRLATVFGKPCFSSQLADGAPDAHFAAKFVKVAGL